MTDKANIYREIFQDKLNTISNNLHLDPTHNNTIQRLLKAGVINAEVRDVLIGIDVNSRGARVVRHIIAVNNLDVYEKFLEIWRDVSQAAALEFEKLLNRNLEGFEMTRHNSVAAPATVQQTVQKDNIPQLPGVTSDTAATSQAAFVPPPGFKWRDIWKEQLNRHRKEILHELKFELTDGVYTDMIQCQPKVLDDNEFVSINALTDPLVRANRLYEVIETRSAQTILTLIELLKTYRRHEALAAELEELYNESVKLYTTKYNLS